MNNNSQLAPELLSAGSMNPLMAHDSSSRQVMFTSSHLGQTLVVEGCDIRRCQSGTEREFGKFTFNIKVPCDAAVIKVVPKFRQSIGKGSISENPSTLIIYENVDTKEVGMIEIINYSTAVDNKHQHFGFKYKHKEIINQLHTGMHLPKDTVLSDSPTIDDNGNYRYGCEANVALMSIPGIIEDGIVISESYALRNKTKGFEKRSVTWGSKYYPLNLYGDSENYKPFPEIGDRVREDGLLFCLRSYDDLLAPVEMTGNALEEPDYIFDKRTYGIPGAKIVDINVQHNSSIQNPPTPTGMEAQVSKYHESIINYHKSVIQVYDDLYSQRGKALNITPEFQRQLVEAMAYIGMENIVALKNFPGRANLLKLKIDKKYRRSDVDDWSVDVAMEYDVVPDIGFKFTDCHGGKGVVCGLWPDHLMPVDTEGNRAEIIMDGDSTIKRMNIGRVYEQYLNACSRDVSKHIRIMVANDPKDGYAKAWDYAIKYYSIVSPRMVDLLTSKKYTPGPKSHIDAIIKDGIYLWMPTDNPVDSVEMINQLVAEFDICFGPVTYADGFVTDRNVLIGSMYVLLLEKTGSDWAGVGSAKLQHFGVPAKVTNADKYSSPGRNQPVRILGEAEIRLLNAIVGSDVCMELLDQSNSPATHKEIVKNILEAESPTTMELMVDRKQIPLGNSRSLLFVKHVLECGGIKFARTIDDPLRAKDMEEVARLQKAKR